jgi:hypothetical protein
MFAIAHIGFDATAGRETDERNYAIAHATCEQSRRRNHAAPHRVAANVAHRPSISIFGRRVASPFAPNFAGGSSPPVQRPASTPGGAAVVIGGVLAVCPPSGSLAGLPEGRAGGFLPRLARQDASLPLVRRICS